VDASNLRPKDHAVNRIAVFFLVPALVSLIFPGPVAKAGDIHWQFQWQPIPQVITSDFAIVPLRGGVPILPNRPIGAIVLSAGPKAGATNSTDLVAASLRAYSLAPDATPAHFTHRKYSFRLTITDLDTKQSGSLMFAGELNGTLSRRSVHIRNTFLDSPAQTIALGFHVFSVTLGPFVPPGPPSARNLGSVGAHVDVHLRVDPPVPLDRLASVVDPPVSKTPEPATIVLAGLGVTMAGLVWRRRQPRPVDS
jgi:hypothetical protein